MKEDVLRVLLIWIGCLLLFYGIYQIYEPLAFIFIGVRIYAWGAPIRWPPFFMRRKEDC